MSEDIEIDFEYEPTPVKPEIGEMLKHASPFREDKQAAERLEKCVKAKSRRFECLGCGITRWVDPVFTGEEWHYWGQCSHCGAQWCNAYRLMIKCEECGKKNPITSRNPQGKCKCSEDTPRPF